MLRPTNATLTVLGAVLATALGGILLLGVRGKVEPVHLLTISWLVLAYSVSGLVAWRCRPHNRFGPLMVLTGFAALAGSLIWADEDGVLHTIGQALDVVPLVLIVHVFVTYPTGRLHGRAEKMIIGTGYAAALGAQVTAMALGGLAPHRMTVADRPEAAMVVYRIELVVVSGVALAGVGLLTVRRRGHGRPLRRSLTLLVDSFAVGLVTIAVLLVVGVF